MHIRQARQHFQSSRKCGADSVNWFTKWLEIKKKTVENEEQAGMLGGACNVRQGSLTPWIPVCTGMTSPSAEGFPRRSAVSIQLEGLSFAFRSS